MRSQRLITTLVLTAFFCMPVYLISNEDGPLPRRTGGPFPGELSCTDADCHVGTVNTGPGSVSIMINGVPANQFVYTPGETVPVTVRVEDPAQMRWGFELTARGPDGCAQAGTFATSPGETPGAVQIFTTNSMDNIPECPPDPLQLPMHMVPKAGPNGADYMFNWTAPATDIGPITFAAAGNAANGDRDPEGDNIYTTNAVVQPAASNGKPTFSSDGFTDAAAFGAPPSVGALTSLFGNFGAALTVATTVPLPEELGGVTVEFENIQAAAARGKKQSTALPAPLLFVSPGQINLQIPWEVDISSGRVQATVTVAGVSSDPVELPVASLSPGLFTFESGPGHAIAINPDGTVAQPAGILQGINSRPVQIGEAVILYATGLGATSPPVVTGDDSLDAQGGFERRDAVELPQVTIGGVPQQLIFAGMSPQFVGVNQINILVVAGTPTGEQPLVIQSGGLMSRNDVTIAVAAN